MNLPFDFTGHHVLITGATSGIGRATAVLLADLGAQVIAVSRDESRLSDLCRSLPNGPHMGRPFDLATIEAIPAFVKSIAAEAGPLLGLVHCAGSHALTPLRVLDAASVRALLCVNVESSLALAKGFRQKGVCSDRASLVFLSSVVGQVGQPAGSAYSASKGAIDALSRSLALELAPENIRVNAIAPGVVWTPMTARLKASLPAENWARIVQMHPLGIGEPEDIAHAIAFLLSPTAARWITGITLTVDGGYTAH